MAKDTRKRLKQTLLALFLGASLILIVATWVESWQEQNVAPSGYYQDAAPTAVYEITPSPQGTRQRGQGQGAGAGRDHETTPAAIPTDDATPTRSVADEEM